MRRLLVALALCACSPTHVQQPRAGTAVATVVAVEVEPLELRPEQRERITWALCLRLMAENQDVWVEAANALLPDTEVAAAYCARPEVLAEFRGLLTDAAAIWAMRRGLEAAKTPCSAPELERRKP